MRNLSPAIGLPTSEMSHLDLYGHHANSLRILPDITARLKGTDRRQIAAHWGTMCMLVGWPAKRAQPAAWLIIGLIDAA